MSTSASFEVPFNLAAVRLMSGATACPPCGTPIAWVSVEDDDGKLTGERRLVEMVDPPHFGGEHTTSPCDTTGDETDG